MLLDAQQCPKEIEETAEAYAMHSLDELNCQRFEEHLLICSNCCAAVAEADKFVKAMIAAARELRRDGR